MYTPTILLVCVALTTTTITSVYSFSAAGRHFVASCPWLGKSADCTAHILTSEIIARVSVNEFLENRIVKIKHFVARRGKPAVKYVSGFGKHHYDSDSTQPISNYPVQVFKSNEYFRVTVLTRIIKSTSSNIDAIQLSPEISCYNSYFTVTAKTNSFFTIFSFGYSTTNVKVEFPEYDALENKFDVNCFASDKCSPGKTVTLNLLYYDLWYFTLDDKEANLLNVHITSDRPVYVVSGNRYGWSARDDYSWDICTTSLKPSATWGKEYIVANVVSNSVSFAISTIGTPSTVYFHEGSTTKELTVTSDQTRMFEYGRVEHTLAVTSNDPFGLYQVFSSRPFGDHNLGDVSILNLIPVEQWKRSSLYVDLELPSTFNVKIYLITQASREIVTIPSGARKDFKWQASAITDRQKTYSVVEFTPKKLTTKFYVHDPSGRMMLYVTIQPSTIGSSFFATYPNNFYQGEIYQKSCKESESLFSHDGIDNDCDGYVDEETQNGVDDDGDGLVDEDNVEPYSDGQWSPWTYACDQPCNGVKLKVKVRSCVNKSYDGNTCDGESVHCDQKTCPRNCERSESNPNGCFCNAACLSCDQNMFECDDGCKSGYSSSHKCLTHLQHVRVIRSFNPPKDEHDNNTEWARSQEEIQEKGLSFVLPYLAILAAALIFKAVVFGFAAETIIQRDLAKIDRIKAQKLQHPIGPPPDTPSQSGQ